ncbi:SNF2 family N-terminal domain-containing protein [Geranomyces variabilis]|nr:SNF2 family N-terminal domain-containing protein [Geranomyces variabilis]
MKARPSKVHVIRASSDESAGDDHTPALQDRRKRRDIQKIRPESEAARRKRETRQRQDQAIAARADKQASEKTSSLIVNLGHDDSEEHIFLAGFLERHLKPHQVDGLRFLWKNIIMVKQPGGSHAGCILAHAMGLGKTLQVIAFLYTLMTEISKNNPAIPEHLRPGRVLIVAPVNVLVNWQAEFFKWIPAYHRQPLREIAVLHSVATETRTNTIQRWHNRGGILTAGYEAMVGLRKAHPAENKMCVEASLLICDEGHLIKNSVTQRTMALASMETPSRILLTGSPLQNHLTEYWCMINFACNDFLDTLPEFRNAYENPIKNGFCLDSTEGDKKLARSRMFVLCKLIEPIVQRMDTSPLKAELPSKTEFTIVCKLTPVQQAAYMKVVATMMGVLGTLPGVIRLCGHPGVFKEELDKKMDISQGKLMGKHAANASAAPIDVEKTASATPIDVEATASVTPVDVEATVSVTPTEMDNSPVLLTDAAADADVMPIIEIDDGPEEPGTPLTKNELAAELAILNKSRPGFDAIFKTIEDPFAEELSVKVKMALAIVKAARTIGEKVLVFSTSIPILHYLLSRFTAHKIASVLMEGATSQTKRQKMIQNFGADEATVFLISTRTGSVGINLQAATRVVVFDIGWNPTDAEQAIARAYRYGQTKPVTVYRLTTYGTFEETLYKINVHKSKLSK